MASKAVWRALVAGAFVGGAAVLTMQALVARGDTSVNPAVASGNRFEISAVGAAGGEPERVYVLDSLNNKVRCYRKASAGWNESDAFVIAQ